MRNGGDPIPNLVECGIRVVDRIVGGLPFPSTILVVSDPLSTPEMFLYSLSRGGYYLASLKSAEVVKTEMDELKFEAEIIDINEENVLDVLEGLENCKVVVEFKFDPEKALKMREISIRNKILLYLCVLKNWYDDKMLSQLMFICEGVLLIESERIGDKFVHKFSIPKMLTGTSMPEFIRFKTQKRMLEIDTSKDIA